MLQIKNTLGGGKPNAPYAWAKYEYEVIPPIDAVNPTFKMSSSSYTVTITESTVDLTLIGDNWREFFDGFKYNSGDYPKFQNGSDLLRIYASSDTASRVTAFTATSPTTGTLTLQDSWSKPSTLCEFIGTKHIKDEESKVGSFIEYITDKSPTKYPNGEVHTDGFFYRYAPEGLYVWKKLSAQGGDFLGYVVSDKETAYPDGGEKGGYWYEKVSEGLTPEMFGCTKMAVEDKTYSSDTSMYNSGNGITHSLGVVPKVVILLAKTSVTSQMISFFYNGNEPISYTPKYIYTYISYGNVNVSGEAMSSETDSSKIVTSGNVYLGAGVTYTLITMA